MTEEMIIEAIDCLKHTRHNNRNCYKLINYLRSNVDDIIEAMGGDEPIEAPMPKYTLWLSIDTDDDAELRYKGNRYCFYGEDLRISKSFDTLTQMIAYLDKEIEVVKGGKATDWVEQFLNDSCLQVIEHDFEDGSYDNQCHGNQVMCFNVSVNN